MKKSETESDTAKIIEQIKEKLDRILGHMAWMIRAEQRFVRGQRVETSRKYRTKTKKGRVVKIDGAFDVSVLFDGRKHPKSLHHSHLNPVTGPKLF